MIHLTLAQTAAIIGAEARQENRLAFRGISLDSRTLLPGNLFIAVQGERFDGHQFIQHAKQQGAAGAIVQHLQAVDLPQIQVADATLALGKLASAWRDTFDLSIIGLTGSNGKTTVKNMLNAIFQAAYSPQAVLATRGNYNNHWGLPLMLSEINPEHRVAILEMGMNHLREIDYLTHLAKPNIALITNAGPVHLAGVGHTLAGVAKAKGEIFAGLTSDGIAIINADDDFAPDWQKLAQPHQVVTFGLSKPADVQGELTPEGMIIRYQQDQALIQLKLMGVHNQRNALAASTVALISGVPLAKIAQALATVSPTPRRMQKLSGLHGSVVIDDGYNANPLSLNAALETLASQASNTILVLGDMRELGQDEIIWHQRAGKKAHELGFQQLLAIGELMQTAVKSFGTGAQHFATHADLIETLIPKLKPGVIVLVKGSFSMDMKQIVDAIKVSE